MNKNICEHCIPENKRFVGKRPYFSCPLEKECKKAIKIYKDNFETDYACTQKEK